MQIRRKSLQEKRRYETIKVLKYFDKESRWNNRIIASEDILARFSLQNQVRKKQKKQLPQLKGTQDIVDKYLRLSEQIKTKQTIVQQDERLFNLRYQQVQNLWRIFKIPRIHQNIFALFMEREQRMEILEQEIYQLDHKISPIQQCTYALLARENCLQVLFAAEQHQEIIDHLRLLTINVVEGIAKWKLSLNVQVIFQTDDQVFYTDRLRSDHSEMVQKGIVDRQFDPFFLASLKDKKLLTRIRRCEAEILGDELLLRVNKDQEQLEMRLMAEVQSTEQIQVKD